MSQLPWHVDAAEFEKFANDREVQNQAELVQANAKAARDSEELEQTRAKLAEHSSLQQALDEGNADISMLQRRLAEVDKHAAEATEVVQAKHRAALQAEFTANAVVQRAKLALTLDGWRMKKEFNQMCDAQAAAHADAMDSVQLVQRISESRQTLEAPAAVSMEEFEKLKQELAECQEQKLQAGANFMPPQFHL